MDCKGLKVRGKEQGVTTNVVLFLPKEPAQRVKEIYQFCTISTKVMSSGFTDKQKHHNKKSLLKPELSPTIK